MLKEITTFIEDKTSSFAIGSTLQVGHRPQDAPDRCSLVAETGGGALEFDLSDKVDKMIQVLSRANTYFAARADAREIFDAIHATAGWDLPIIDVGIKYVAMTIEAVSDPAYIGKDENGRFEFSCNYIFRIRDK